jgi:hypothetical protein
VRLRRAAFTASAPAVAIYNSFMFLARRAPRPEFAQVRVHRRRIDAVALPVAAMQQSVGAA